LTNQQQPQKTLTTLNNAENIDRFDKATLANDKQEELCTYYPRSLRFSAWSELFCDLAVRSNRGAEFEELRTRL
jgi:hypothetical protein